MASLFKRKRSGFWWIKFTDARGKSVRRATPYHHRVALETKQAQVLRNTKATEELQRGRGDKSAEWSVWVPAFIEARYAKSVKTKTRMLYAWQRLEAYLQERKIRHPANLTYAHCFEYVAWRIADHPDLGIKPAHQNTALTELTMLGTLMQHAVRTNLCPTNYCRNLNIPKLPRKKKGEISEEELHAVWRALKDIERRPQGRRKGPAPAIPYDPRTHAEWMRTSFLIGLHTGCRISETRILLRNVSFVEETIMFDDPKGGPDRAFTTLLPKALVTLFTRLVAEGRAYSLDFPGPSPQASKEWIRLFRSLGMPYSFHCFRVTYISRACRRGIPENVVCQLVNHSSHLVNRLYQRHRVEDLRKAAESLQMPSFDSTPPQVENPPET